MLAKRPLLRGKPAEISGNPARLGEHKHYSLRLLRQPGIKESSQREEK